MTDDERTKDEVEEKQRLRLLRTQVDLTCALIAQSANSRAEAEALAAATRRRALTLFPDKGAVFDLVIAPRFARLIDERFGEPPSRGRVLPFRKP